MEDSNPKNAQTSGAEDTSSPDIYRNCVLFTYSENSFAIAVGPDTTRVAWAEVQALFGYKRDLYAYDLVCLDIFLPKGLSLSLHEQVAGWHQFARKLAAQFPGIRQGWEIDLSFPPFAPNFTLLYERHSLPQEQAIRAYYRPEPPLKKKIAAWLGQLFHKAAT